MQAVQAQVAGTVDGWTGEQELLAYRGTGWCTMPIHPPRSVLASVGVYSHLPSLPHIFLTT